MALADFGFIAQPGSKVTQRASVQNEELLGANIYSDARYLVLEQVGNPTLEAGVIRDPAAVVDLETPGLVLNANGVTDSGVLQQTGSVLDQQTSVQNVEIVGANIYDDRRYLSFEHVGAPTLEAGAVRVNESVAPIQSASAFSLPEGVLPTPTVTSIDPTSGVQAGGNGFTIIGTDFVSGATVSFGANPATGLIVTATQITGTVPAGAALGVVTVTVTNPDLQTATTTYTYTAVPAVPAFFEISPDLGLIDFNTHFDPAVNGLLVQVDESDLTVVGGSEGDPTVKGVGAFRITLNGIVYEVPLSVRRRLRVRNRGRVIWRTAAGDSGVFRFFREAPAVFEEEVLV